MYKLIKLYPGSPKLGTTAINKQGSIGYIYPDGKTEVEISSSGDIFKRMVEDMPEFWEKVVEFEVLSVYSEAYGILFKDKYGHYRYVTSGSGGFALSWEEVLRRKYTIHSVERISDGEIFHIGDKIKVTTLGEIKIIDRIKLCEEDGSSFKKGIWVYFSTGGCHFDNITKYSPLFTTEDGVDVFEGDTYWCVNNASHLWSLFEQTSKERTKLNKTVLSFSTKEKAKEYILMNKPCLSLQDILDSGWEFNSKGNAINSPLFKQFKETAKSKLK